MKQLFVLSVFLLGMLCCNVSIAQPIDSTSLTTNTITKEHTADDDDFAPGLFIGAVIMLGIATVAVLAGSILAALAVLAILGLIPIGIITTSIFVGIQKRSAEKGFKFFLVLTAAMGGTVMGGLSAFLFHYLLHSQYTIPTVIAAGAFLGLIAGIAFGNILFYVFQRLVVFVKQKMV